MKSEIFFMQRAIELSKFGKYNVSPNPMVGCVITEKSKIISEGYHSRFGSDHAEISALKKLKKKVNNKMNMYVSLEPCCHVGKTGPCVDSIINSGIRNIYIAMLDPNPKVKGKGVKKLKSHGINVKVGICQKEAEEVNKGFISRIKKNKPYVTIKQAISIDNKISNKKSKWISNKDSRKDAQFIRAESCAILIGSETLLKDNPKLNVKLKNSDLNTNIKIRNPIKIILDSKLSIDISKYKLFKGKEKKIIFNNIITDFDENNNIDYIKVSKNNLGLNLESILNILAKKYEINYLMVEPGAKLLKSFVLKNLIDDLIIYKCPLIIGKLGLSSFSICNEYLNKNNIEIDTIKQISNDVKIIYKFKRK